MKIKKFIILATLLVISPCIIFAKDFKDVQKNGKYSWAYEHIYKLSEENILTGFPNGTFMPGRAVSFLETLQILKTVNKPIDNSIDQAKMKYENILNEYKIPEWAKDSCAFALDRQIVTETTLKSAYNKNLISGKVYPSRNTIALLFARSLKLNKKNSTLSLTYMDINNIPGEIKDILPNLIDAGIFSKEGSEGNFNGSKYIRRAEMAVITSKTRDYILNNPIDDLIEGNSVINASNIINKNSGDKLTSNENDQYELLNSRVNFRARVNKIIDGGTIKYLELDIMESDNKNLILPKSILTESIYDHTIGDMVEGTATLDGQNLINISLIN